MPKRIPRRDFIKLGLAATGGAVASRLVSFDPFTDHGAASPPSIQTSGRPNASPATRPAISVGGSSAPQTSTTLLAKSPSDPATRVLVMIEFQGGNDGLNTLVPIKDPAYRSLRSKVSLPDDKLLRFTDEFSLHPSLARVAKRDLAVVAGVGVANPDGSHFEMMRRWWTGDLNGKTNPTTGFLGRIADTIGSKDSPAVALGLGQGASTTLTSAWAPTLRLGGIDAAQLFRENSDDRMLTTFQNGFRHLSENATDVAPARALVQSGMGQALGAARLLGGPETTATDKTDLPDTGLGNSLRAVLPLVRQPQLGLRIVHLSHDGFDTHENALDQQADRLDEFDAAVDGFFAALDRDGLSDRVLVATTSEFGRRAKDNDSNGLDHGAASVALLVGPVNRGVFGEYPSLTQLDDEDNLKATVSMGAYYATLASWFGVDRNDVLGSGVDAPLDKVFKI
jgi:uncharacterized protein (DUF1501 family)